MWSYEGRVEELEAMLASPKMKVPGLGPRRRRARTIVTQQHGAFAGRRVVRGREEECARYYEDNVEVAVSSV